MSNVVEARRIGVLPSQQLREIVRNRVITSTVEIDATQIQPASLDLRLGKRAYRVSARADSDQSVSYPQALK